MGNHAVVAPPVRPAALLSYILARCAHPTTLIVCSTSPDFVQRCVHDDNNEGDDSITESLHTASLLQVAVARHIRVAFVPTVAHLRGFLAAFDLAASRVPAPPQVLISDSNSSSSNSFSHSVNRGDRVLVVYDFVRLHRATSEWSGQGLGASVAVLAEAGWRTGLDVLVVESGVLVSSVQPLQSVEDETPVTKYETVLDERTPVLSTAARKQLQRAGYPLRTERVRAVLTRWLTLKQQLDEESEITEQEKSEEEVTDVVVASDKEPTQHASQGHAGGKGSTREKTGASAPGETVGTATDHEQNVDSTQIVETRPKRTFVKDSEDEDDLSDDGLYPIDNII